jgi:hypothetical protein
MPSPRPILKHARAPEESDSPPTPRRRQVYVESGPNCKARILLIHIPFLNSRKTICLLILSISFPSAIVNLVFFFSRYKFASRHYFCGKKKKQSIKDSSVFLFFSISRPYRKSILLFVQRLEKPSDISFVDHFTFLRKWSKKRDQIISTKKKKKR